MRVSQTLILIFALMCSGCGFLIGKLPEPDKFWSIAMSGSANKNCKEASPLKTGCNEDFQQSASASINSYVKSKLPLLSEALKVFLEKEQFICRQVYGHQIMTCTYIKSQAPEPCVLRTQVVIEINFSADPHIVVSPEKVKVTAMAVNTEEQEGLGCFPL